MKKNKSRRILLILSPFIIIFCILAYYQLFYKSERVNGNYAHLEYTFKGHTSIVTAVRFTPGDSLVVTSSVDSTIRIWKRATGEIIHTFRQPQGISYMDLSNSGDLVVTGSYDSSVRIWSISENKMLREFKGHNGTVWTVAFSPDDKMIASSGDDKTIIIWDVVSGKILHSLKGHKRIVWSVKFSPDGKSLVSASYDFTLKTWNVDDGKLIRDNREHTETVVDVAFSHNGKLIASTSDDKTIRIWNSSSGELIRKMKVAEHVQAVAFSPDDKRLLTGGRDKPLIGEFLQVIFGNSEFNKGVSARLWDVESGKLLQTFQQHRNDVQDVAYSHNGKWIATASADGTAMVWEVK